MTNNKLIFMVGSFGSGKADLVGALRQILSELDPPIVESVPEPHPLNDLAMSVRTLNALERAGFDTIEQVAKKGRREIRKVKGLGNKGVKELSEILDSFGLEWRS